MLPDDTPAHSYEAAMDLVELAPNARATEYPWKESKDTYDRTVARVREFLLAHAS